MEEGLEVNILEAHLECQGLSFWGLAGVVRILTDTYWESVVSTNRQSFQGEGEGTRIGDVGRSFR